MGVGVGVGDGASGPDVGVGIVLDADWTDVCDGVAPDGGPNSIGIESTRSAVIPKAPARLDDRSDRLMVPSSHALRVRAVHTVPWWSHSTCSPYFP